MIRDWIRNWLGINEILNRLIIRAEDIAEDKYNYHFVVSEMVGLNNKYGALENKMLNIDERLRPDLRTKLEQCESAIDIQTKFLNEINYEIKNSIFK